ncbi:hypothetical protein BDR26DRAFT_729595 [Obelidium mucronatum]|nr:hypothetical protein BDR26DRAFT_729595 [Obelidium mucronatum]
MLLQAAPMMVTTIPIHRVPDWFAALQNWSVSEPGVHFFSPAHVDTAMALVPKAEHVASSGPPPQHAMPAEKVGRRSGFAGLNSAVESGEHVDAIVQNAGSHSPARYAAASRLAFAGAAAVAAAAGPSSAASVALCARRRAIHWYCAQSDAFEQTWPVCSNDVALVALVTRTRTPSPAATVSVHMLLTHTYAETPVAPISAVAAAQSVSVVHGIGDDKDGLAADTNTTDDSPRSRTHAACRLRTAVNAFVLICQKRRKGVWLLGLPN